MGRIFFIQRFWTYRNIMKFKILDSFKYKGKYSSRKLTVFVAFVLLNMLFLTELYFNKTVSETLVIIYGVIVLIGLGFLTSENVVDILRRNNDYPYYDPYISNTNINVSNKRKDKEINEEDTRLPME